jgi:hypothetical protein
VTNRHTVAMLLTDYGTPRALEAREELAAVLPGAEVTEPDEVGAFEVVVDAKDQEAALTSVWDAVAASGTDDHIVFLEHPDLPQHWRHLSRRPPTHDDAREQEE